MGKIEPITVEEIKYLIAQYGAPSAKWARLILAWAHERAEKNRAEHPDTCEQCLTAYHDKDKCHRNSWAMFADWLNEVLDEIGFPHEAR